MNQLKYHNYHQKVYSLYTREERKDEKEIKKAENSIMLLAKAVPLGLKEMVILDEMVQEILEKKVQENLTK